MQKAKDMELRTLNKRHAFGIKSDVYGCLHWLDEHTLTYPVGRNVVIHNTSTNTQRFFLTSEKTESITAIALSPNRKYIAIAESGEHPQIQIVDTNTRKRRRVLNVSDLGSDRFVAVEFSADGRHLVTQGGHPSWNLLYWNWERSRPLAQVAVTPEQQGGVGGAPARDAKDANRVTKVSINPKDPLHIAVSGHGVFRFYRYVDGTLKLSPGGPPKAQTFNFTTHTWVTDERIVVATDNADLLYIEEGEYRGHLASAPSDGHPILTIERKTNGFICGGENGYIHVFEEADDKDVYRKAKTLTLESKDLPDDMSKRSAIRAFALTSGEDTLAMATSTMQIYGLKCPQEWNRFETPVFSSIAQPFHAGPIVGLDTCVRKPLVATSSLDCTIRIWNVQDHTVEVIKHFAHEPGAIALHPSGLHILVCFQDKVKFMNLYGETIHEFRQFVIRGVNEVKFSVGGQYFAVVYASTIQVYKTYTCEQIATLRANSQKVRAIQWASATQHPLDTRLIACTTDGMVMDYPLQRDSARPPDHSDKRFQYHAVAADERNIYVVGTPASRDADSKWKVKLREIEADKMGGDVVSTDYEFPELHLTTLALATSHRLLFGGCSDGSIKLMTFPLQGGIHDPPILAHAAPVTRIAVSYDENLFFSVGQDGSFYMFDIKEDGRSGKRETTYADEILISRGDLEEKAANRAALHHMVQDLEHGMEYNDKRRLTQHNERMKEQQNLFQEEADRQAQQFAAVWNAKLDQEREFAEIRRDKLEQHSAAIAAAESKYEDKLRELKQQCTERKSLEDHQREGFAAEMKALRDEAAAELSEAQLKFDAKLQQKKTTIKNLEDAINRDGKTHGEMQDQLEKDCDTEIENVKTKYEHRLTQEREAYLHMKGENAIYKKAFVQFTKENENKEADLRLLESNKDRLLETLKGLTAQTVKLQVEMEEKDQTIAEKEKKIYELKKKNQELEKHKFVLDHRIRQLKALIEPRQMQIAREKEKIQAKDKELEQFHKNNLSLRSSIFELRDTILTQQAEIKQLLNKLKDFDTYRSRVKTDIGELAQLVQDPDQLKSGVEKVFHDHVVARRGKRTAPLASELKAEFNTHTEFLARTVESLKRKVSEDRTAHRSEVSSVMKDNLGLIKEINDLRKDIAKLRSVQPDGGAGGPSGGSTVGSPVLASTAGLGGSASPATLGSVHHDPAALAATQREIEANRQEMRKLRTKIEELEKSIAIRSQPRPASRDRVLPSLNQTH